MDAKKTKKKRTDNNIKSDSDRRSQPKEEEEENNTSPSLSLIKVTESNQNNNEDESISTHHPLTTSTSSTGTSKSSSSPRLTALQSRLLSQQSWQHMATSQLGGKGTIRRRRLRKVASLAPATDVADLKHAFLSKFDVNECGQMERVTFVNDDGDVTSYDGIKLAANFKANIFYLNFAPYRAVKKRRSNTKMLSSEEAAATESEPNVAVVKKGIRNDKASDLLDNLEFMDRKELLLNNEVFFFCLNLNIF